ncbi:histidine protein methyltransferase 1 homolog isoform X2 [Lucilia sericata]|uniref:histidine protein methyltransferase 1 homolog isoform X2 n=1 Tax=Lucilia sericata TaxID=13632 RepID=UPI0018A86AE4|nr:histidine protein methyltransferase 1 homolog isoform X2 [Lucilia sericata]
MPNILKIKKKHWYEAEEILLSKEIIENIDVCKLNSTQKTIDGVNITHMVSGFLLEDIKDNENTDLDIKKAEEQHSDLIPGVYEGGAKIWECTNDLLQYLAQNFKEDKWQTSKVLDLGCGSGLLGIYAFLKGAKVTFQDYNKDVLEKITIPNVLLNTATTNEKEDGDQEVLYDVKKIEENVKFYSGDWSKWSQMCEKEDKYDIILTSETIYNPQNQQKLLNCLHDQLKPNGVVLVAAKIYYFGVGGGLRQFEELIEKDKRFVSKTVWLSTEGVNREIVELIKST